MGKKELIVKTKYEELYKTEYGYWIEHIEYEDEAETVRFEGGGCSISNGVVDKLLDRAREEGRKAERDRIFRGLDSIDCIKEALPKNYSASGMQFGIYRAKEIVLEKELSKLATK